MKIIVILYLRNENNFHLHDNKEEIKRQGVDIMLLYKVKDFKELSRKAANIISAQVILKPTSVLGLATGSTPVGTYKQLIEWYEKGDIDFSQVTTINLDEYKGLGAADVQSYRYFMNDNLFNHVNVNKDRTFVPNGLTEDPEEACKAYDDLIATCGGIDLQLLGIGGNGHIGFNEPTDSYIKATHVVTLSENTRSTNARFFASMEEVPTHAITMGIGGIMEAKKILLLASGKAKAQAIYDALYGPITPQVPASILQLHPDVIVVADEEALSLL